MAYVKSNNVAVTTDIGVRQNICLYNLPDTLATSHTGNTLHLHLTPNIMPQSLNISFHKIDNFRTIITSNTFKSSGNPFLSSIRAKNNTMLKIWLKNWMLHFKMVALHHL